VEAFAAGTCDVLVGCAPEGAEQDRVRDRLQQIRLALSVGAEQREPLSGELAIKVRQVAESSRHQSLEPHPFLGISTFKNTRTGRRIEPQSGREQPV
jgi:hypothetical protein